MNYSIIIFILGWILKFTGVLMMVPGLTAVIYRERSGFAFLIMILVSGAAGLLITRKKPKNQVFHIKEAFVTTSFSWILLSIVGAAPFVISGSIPHPVDALFETVSGFTTTGASILPSVEALPHCMLMWRSFTHWIGGMGVLVFLLCLLPLTGGYNMTLMKAESPGPSVSRLVPKVRSTAKWLYAIYLGLTLLEMVFLLVGRMPLFDTICTAIGTAGTGGFGIKNDSFTGYNMYLQGVVTVFMILFGINFSAYYLIISKKYRQALEIEEIRYYLGLNAAAILVIGVNVRHLFPNIWHSLHHAAFQVASIITTTGFATKDFNQWPTLSKTILVMLMFVGACAGSTGGGIKVSRVLIFLKTLRKEFHLYLHPNAIKKIQMDKKPVAHDVVRAANTYMILYIVLYGISMLVLSMDNLDLTTNFTAVAATLNNIGPGLEQVGPSANFAVFSTLPKCMLIVDMLAGRLELFPLFILFSRDTWKKF